VRKASLLSSKGAAPLRTLLQCFWCSRIGQCAERRGSPRSSAGGRSPFYTIDMGAKRSRYGINEGAMLDGYMW
jgi:hypothetical protein